VWWAILLIPQDANPRWIGYQSNLIAWLHFAASLSAPNGLKSPSAVPLLSLVFL
jgi:hypothetical protein